MRKLYAKLLFLVLAASGSIALGQYCATTNAGGTGSMMDVVSLNTLNNNSAATNPTASPYYTSYAFGTNLVQGVSYPLSVTVGPAGVYTGAIVSVWIDWNQNLTYEASEWQQVGTSVAGGTTATITVTVPITAPVGATGMRIRSRGAGNINGAGDACTIMGSGETEDYIVTVISTVGCSGAPTAGTAVAGTNPICPSVPFNLTLSGATNASGMTYQWQSAASATGPWTNITGATGTAYQATQTTNTWYQCIVTCTASSLSATSTPVLVNTSSFMNCYCGSAATSAIYDEEIYNVTVNGSSTNPLYANTNGCSTPAPGPGSILGGYSNFKTLPALTTVLTGQSVTFSINQDECDGPTYYSNGIGIWIDYNQNGSFADAGEAVFIEAATAVGPRTVTGSFTIPFTAVTGNTVMRVICAEGYSGASLQPCLSYGYGETEDYLINITASTACSGTPVAGTAVSSATSICPGINYSLSLSGATLASGLTYQWQSAPSATGPWTNVPSGNQPNITVSQLVNTWYQCIVTCSGLSATSSVVGVTTNSFLACYCGSQATSIADEEILNVTLNTLNNSSTCGTAAPGPGSLASQYSNFTTLPATNLAPGVVYPLSVEIGTCGGNYTNGTKVWIDFNHNGLFTDPGEEVYASAAMVVGPHVETGNITIPTGTPTGNTMMRVVNVETWAITNINPCGNYTWGETEDYLVNITAPPTCPQPTSFSLIQANNTTAQVEWVAGGSETQWQIEYGLQGFTPGTGTTVIVTSNPYTITGLTPNSFYTAYIQGICTPGDTSFWTPSITWNTYNQGQYVDWDNECPTAGFEDISGFATNANLLDDQELGVTLPFTFLYQGILTNTMTIGDNGGVILGTTTGQVGYAMPASGNGLFPYIQDLYTGGNAGQNIYYGQVGNSPNAKFIVQWNNVPHYTFPAPTNGATFQLVIEEATNEIYYVYEDVDMGNVAWNNGADAEIGLRGPHNVNVSMNNSTYLENNTCVHFYYTNCPKPTSFATNYVAPDEAMLTWSAGAANETNWTIIYGPQGFDPTTGGTTVTSTTNSVILTNLNQLTAYDVYIYADCAVGLQSFGLEGSFVTPPFCANPSNLAATTTVGNIDASWSWVAYSAQYPSTGFNVQLTQPGAALYTGSTYNLNNNTTNTISSASFMAGQTFDVYVQAVCGQDTSFYVGPFNVIMPLTNDTICGAQAIPVDGNTYVFNNTGAGFDVNEVAIVPPATGAQTTTGWANQNLELSTWFKFVAPASGAVRINCTGVNYNGQAAVYSATSCNNIPSFQLMAANDDDLGGINQAPNFTVCGLTPGTEYYMMHDAFNLTAGNYGISIYEIVLDAGVEGEVLLACYGDTVNLFLGIANYQNGGTWSETTPTLGLNNNLFNTNGLASTSYEFTYTMQDGCASDASHAYVEIFSAPNAGVGGNINVCLNEPFNLLSGLSGVVDLTGVWTNPSNVTMPSSQDTSGTTGGTFQYTYTASNGVCPDESTTVSVIVNGSCDFTAGILDLATGFELYPNPTRNTVNVSWTTSGTTSVKLTDLNGKVLQSENTAAQQTTLDLSNYTPGVYILTVQTGEQVATERIIKQ